MILVVMKEQSKLVGVLKISFITDLILYLEWITFCSFIYDADLIEFWYSGFGANAGDDSGGWITQNLEKRNG